MKNILVVGQKPETVDYNQPGIPAGMSAEKIYVGINVATKHMNARGWHTETCMITADNAGAKQLMSKLSSNHYDCIVVGGGLRLPPKNLIFFERIMNLLRKAAPKSEIAFNTVPEDTPEAVARRLDKAKALEADFA